MFAFSLMTEVRTTSEKIKRMMGYLKIKQGLGGVLYLLNARITKLKYLFTIHTNQMIVLAELVGTLELRKILSKLMFGNQMAVQQQVNGVV